MNKNRPQQRDGDSNDGEEDQRLMAPRKISMKNEVEIKNQS